MVKRLFMIVLIFACSLSSLHASAVTGLKRAFEELNYALEVEWDQRDEVFKQAEVEKFHHKVRELQKNGLTQKEFLEFSLSEMKDQTLRTQMEGTLNLLKMNALSEAEAKNIMQNNLEKSLSKGASWNGKLSTVAGTVLFVIVALVLLSSTSGESNKQDLPKGPQPDGSFCGYGEVCSWQAPDCFFSSWSMKCDPNSIWYGDKEYVCESQYTCVK
jgi:hypothetical protein